MTLTTKEKIQYLRDVKSKIFDLRTYQAISSDEEKQISDILKICLDRQYKEFGKQMYQDKV